MTLILSLSLLLVLGFPPLSSTLKLPIGRTALKNFVTVSDASMGSLLANANNSQGSSSIGNIGNIRYTTSIRINGKDVHVALDTGSTDLWVIPPGGIGTFNDTGLGLSLHYGDGTYGVAGTIGVAPFEFGPYQIERQAFLLANALARYKSTIGAMTDLGIYGLFGLGFDDPRTSPINREILQRFGPDATWGASVLENIFGQNLSRPNFIGVDLARTENLEGTAGGSFNIGEYDEAYAVVASTPKLSQYPVGGGRWTTLLDGIIVDGSPIKMKSAIDGVPPGKVVALADTGSPAGIFTADIMEGIFSRMRGSVYDPDSRYWVIPCDATANVALAFGRNVYPIHPLDLTTIRTVMVNGGNYTMCTGSFSVQENIGGNEFDIVLGDTFLRNVYTIYNFGDPAPQNSTPYMQFLSQIDPSEAVSELLAVRAKTLSSMPPELPPRELIGLI